MNYDDIEREKARQRGPITLPLPYEIGLWAIIALVVGMVGWIITALI